MRASSSGRSLVLPPTHLTIGRASETRRSLRRGANDARHATDGKPLRQSSSARDHGANFWARDACTSISASRRDILDAMRGLVLVVLVAACSDPGVLIDVHTDASITSVEVFVARAQSANRMGMPPAASARPTQGPVVLDDRSHGRRGRQGRPRARAAPARRPHRGARDPRARARRPGQRGGLRGASPIRAARSSCRQRRRVHLVVDLDAAAPTTIAQSRTPGTGVHSRGGPSSRKARTIRGGRASRCSRRTTPPSRARSSVPTRTPIAMPRSPSATTPGSCASRIRASARPPPIRTSTPRMPAGSATPPAAATTCRAPPTSACRRPCRRSACRRRSAINAPSSIRAASRRTCSTATRCTSNARSMRTSRGRRPSRRCARTARR